VTPSISAALCAGDPADPVQERHPREGVVVRAAVDRRADQAGRHRVDADVVRGQLGRQARGQGVDPPLAHQGRRRRQPRKGVVDQDRAGVHDAAAPLTLHLPDDRLRGQVGPLQVAAQVAVELWIDRRDGRRRHYLRTFSPVLDARGDVSHVIGFGEEITELKRSEEELRRALAEMAALKERLQAENVYLRQEIRERSIGGNHRCCNSLILEVLRLVDIAQERSA
jgi:PAS domain-containing protein